MGGRGFSIFAVEMNHTAKETDMLDPETQSQVSTVESHKIWPASSHMGIEQPIARLSLGVNRTRQFPRRCDERNMPRKASRDMLAAELLSLRC